MVILKCFFVMCIILLICNIVVDAFGPYYKDSYVVLIEPNQPLVHVANKKFLSVAIDSSLIADGFGNFNLTNPLLLKLISPLSPAYMRIGGTMADRLWFEPTPNVTFKKLQTAPSDGGVCSYDNDQCELFQRSNFTMSGKEWLGLSSLARAANLTILFDLNCLIRHRNGSWNYENAETLINFSDQHRLDVIWELGNEPNSFRHVFDYEVKADQLAKDFFILRNILNNYPRYKGALLVGPDTTRPQKNNSSRKYLKKFLQNAGSSIDAITWHQYYFNEKTARYKSFLDPTTFDILIDQIDSVKEIVNSTGVANKPIWLGETSSAYGGGKPGYSNTYISTFIWLDKLGLSARNGLDLLIRQSLYKGFYALIDNDLFPRPDWWLSVIYKQLVGPQVVPCKTNSSSHVRMYCHCAKSNLFHSSPSVVVYGMNLLSKKAQVKISGLETNRVDGEKLEAYIYLLTSDGFVLSKHILLNGEQLELSPDGNLPLFKPKRVVLDEFLILPPRSSIFCVIPSSTLKYC